MLSAFERAVGPVQPSELPNMQEWHCSAALTAAEVEQGQRAPCLFFLFDAGVGRTYTQCATHGTTALAADWTAPHFVGTASLPEVIGRLNELFVEAGKVGAKTAPDSVSIKAERFGDLLVGVVRNVEALVVELKQHEQDARDRANEVVEKDR